MTGVKQIVIERTLAHLSSTRDGEKTLVAIVAKPDGTFDIHRYYRGAKRLEMFALNLRDAIAMADVELGLLNNELAALEKSKCS